MSAIAGVSGSSLTAFSYFRAVFEGPAEADPSSSAAADDPASTSAASVLAASTSAISLLDAAQSGPGAVQASQGGHLHHHHGGHGGEIDQIEQAVIDALQSAQDDSSADPNKLIEQALAQLFQTFGSGAADGNAGNSGGADPAAGLSLDGSAAPSAGRGWGGRAATNAAFVEALQSAGIDPAQFRTDFLAAIKDAQSGQVNAATALQSLPPGGQLDIMA